MFSSLFRKTFIQIIMTFFVLISMVSPAVAKNIKANSIHNFLRDSDGNLLQLAAKAKDSTKICHNGSQTLELPASAVKAHLKHGDTRGECKTSSQNEDNNGGSNNGGGQTNIPKDEWDISNEPLFVASTAAPLITILWDDSGSMLLETSPESTSYVNLAYPVSFSTAKYYATAKFGGNTNSKMVRDPKKNALFFDPFKEYKPWVKADGTFFSDASYNSLYKTPNKIHPDDIRVQYSSACRNVDLTKAYTPCHKYTICNGTSNCQYKRQNAFWPGEFYYGGRKYNLKDTKKQYRGGHFYSGSPAVTAEKLLDKAANWYTYYRDRKNVAKAALGYALQDVPDNVEVGFTTFTYAKDNPIQPLLYQHNALTNDNKKGLYDSIYNEDNAGGTPLREALLNVNNYIAKNDNLWYDENKNPLSCRRAYNIIISDGNWSNGNLDFRVNADGTKGLNIIGSQGRKYQYDPNANDSYKDSYGGTLADIAMYSWKNDIRTDLDNNVFTPRGAKNPAFWQHIVTHSINLNDDISDTIPSSWPNMLNNYNSNKRYLDMWHASLNSKGQYLHSTDFESLRIALNTFLYDASSITSNVGFVNTGVIGNSYSIGNNSRVFKTFFNPTTWSGEVKAVNISAKGTTVNGDSDLVWVASKKLPAPNDREVIAMLKSSGSKVKPAAFRWSSLSKDTKDILGSASIVNYFRGDRSLEGYQYSSGKRGLRLRSNPLGDFINSKPIFVSKPPFNYSFDNYERFKTARANRDPMVYVASNAGFLHGFSAIDGKELFAITTQHAINKMSERSKHSYKHKYSIDGSPKAGDAYFNNNWNTLLVTPFGAGGQGLFSINITNPNNITESNASNLDGNGFWHFDDSNDSDLGYTLSKPLISRINDSSSKSVWGVIFGNGYNNTANDANKSTTGNAVLYVLDAEDGKIISKLDTGLGKAQDPLNKNRPNGLSTPRVIDYNGNGRIDYAYAGDMFGNLWKFDLTDTDSKKWTVSKLFNNKNSNQSITSAPDVMKSAKGEGVIVYFGTGRFLGILDKTSQQSNSLYAIYDNMKKINISTADMVQQTISSSSKNSKTVSNNTVDFAAKYGWYMNLPNGEIVLNNPKLSQGYLLLATYLPDPNNTVCVNKQKGYLYALNPLTGGTTTKAVIDINGDDVIDDNDATGTNTIPVIELGTGYNSSPIVMKVDNNNNAVILNTPEGNLLPVITRRNADPATIRRRSWKKIRTLDSEKVVDDDDDDNNTDDDNTL